MTAIDEKFAQFGGAQSFLGAPSGSEHASSTASWPRPASTLVTPTIEDR